MAKLQVVLTGDKRLNRKLRRLAGPEAKKIVKQESRIALKPVLSDTRANTPKRSGFLSKNTKIRAIPRSRKYVGSRVTASPGKNMNAGDAFYGAFVVYGTKQRYHQSGKSTGAMVPNNYIKRVADRNRSSVIRSYGAGIGRRIKELGKRG